MRGAAASLRTSAGREGEVTGGARPHRVPNHVGEEQRRSRDPLERRKVRLRALLLPLNREGEEELDGTNELSRCLQRSSAAGRGAASRAATPAQTSCSNAARAAEGARSSELVLAPTELNSMVAELKSAAAELESMTDGGGVGAGCFVDDRGCRPEQAGRSAPSQAVPRCERRRARGGAHCSTTEGVRGAVDTAPRGRRASSGPAPSSLACGGHRGLWRKIGGRGPLERPRDLRSSAALAPCRRRRARPAPLRPSARVTRPASPFAIEERGSGFLHPLSPP